MSKIIETRTATLWLDDALGIIMFDGLDGSEQDARDAADNIAAVRELSKHLKRPLLCDITSVKWVDSRAIAVYRSKETAGAYSAIALVTASTISRTLGNVFLALRGSGGIPTRIFASRPDAIAWLQRLPTPAGSGDP
jgi:hypothetical protein